MSDIKFDGEYVLIEGTWTKLATLDLMLDAPSRRRVAGGFRRALVHDGNDGLTINWASDYPGGVTINGDVKLTQMSGYQLKLAYADVLLDKPERRRVTTGMRRALVHDFNDGLTLNWSSDYPGGVTINGAVTIPGSLTVASQNVGSLLAGFETRIRQLEDRVRALEGR